MAPSLDAPPFAGSSGRLRYADPSEPGIARRRQGRGMVYTRPDGRRVGDEATLARIRTLAIPPAWTEVWIAPDAGGHIQAVGRDERGRRQYIYHPRFRAAREADKYRRLAAFAAGLPALRDKVAADMALAGLPRGKVVATVVHLLDRTLIRIGNRAYAEENRSFGLSTLKSRHAAVAGSTVRFAFKGKSGKEWNVAVSDRRVARVVRACQELPGQPLFQYVDGEGGRRTVSSDDVNAYLREATGRKVSAKDFRTWAGTVLCAAALAGPKPASERQAKREAAEAIRRVAHRLGNTPAVCRACYVHPKVIAAHAAGALLPLAEALALHDEAPREGLSPAERAVLALLAGMAKRPRPRRPRRERPAEASLAA